MKLAISGVMYLHKRLPEIGEYARFLAEKMLKNHPRIKKVRITYFEHEPNWSYGYSWLVRYDQVEIAIPTRLMRRTGQMKWLVQHELCHARQILEGRLNKNMEHIRFTNRRGNTRTFKYSYRDKGFYCVETGKFVEGKEPWEMEVHGDTRRTEARRKSSARKSRS